MKPAGHWLGFAVLGFAAACSAGGPKVPEPSSVRVTLALPSTPTSGVATDAGWPVDAGWDGGAGLPPVTITSPLRYALLWVTKAGGDAGPERALATDDGPVLSLDETLTLRLVMPPSDVVRELAPVESIAFTNQTRVSTVYVPAYYPKLVIYEDVDQDGSYAPDGLDGPARDRVLGVVHQSAAIAAVLDPEAALKAIPENAVESYYAASGGRFTPFVQASDQSLAMDWQPTLGLTLDGWSFDALPRDCHRVMASGQRASHAYLVDEAAGEVSCVVLSASREISTCQVVSLQGSGAPEVTPLRTLQRQRTALCTLSGDLQLLRVSESMPAPIDPAGRVAFAGFGTCGATIDLVETTYVASASALPPWWPCGSAVPFQ